MEIISSVVLATYQGEEFIGEQLDSILAQIGPNDEIVISDDASTDETLGIVRRRNDPRILIIVNNERVGYVMNFQRALDRARGQYIFFSDQDDIWLPGKMAAMHTALGLVGFAASDAVVVNDSLEPMHESFFALRGATRFTWCAIFLKPCIIGATMCCRRDYLKSLLPLPAGIPHDFWLSLNAAWDHQLKAILVPMILYRRHLAAHSPTATRRTRELGIVFRERLRIIRMMLLRRLLSP